MNLKTNEALGRAIKLTEGQVCTINRSIDVTHGHPGIPEHAVHHRAVA